MYERIKKGEKRNLSHSSNFVIQRKTDDYKTRKNNTGLPYNIKFGTESLSGYSMDNVNVHYNSMKPAHIGALAYTQGTDIYIGPGQEKHLPHEAWHVVQQMQGRVYPTCSKYNINNDPALEQEADIMGRKVSQMKSDSFAELPPKYVTGSVLQRYAEKYRNADGEEQEVIFNTLGELYREERAEQRERAVIYVLGKMFSMEMVNSIDISGFNTWEDIKSYLGGYFAGSIFNKYKYDMMRWGFYNTHIDFYKTNSEGKNTMNQYLGNMPK